MEKVRNKEIARLAGVSPAAVSVALHGKKGVSEETRQRILAVARELNYVPPSRMRDGRESIVLLSDTMTGCTAEETMGALAGICRQQNLELRLMTREQVRDDPSGILGGCVWLVTFDLPDRNDMEWLTGLGPRILVMDGSFGRKSADTLRLDYAGAVYTLAKHLTDTGHRNLLYFNQELTLDHNLSGFSGFQRLILEKKLLLNPRQVIMDGSGNPQTLSRLPEIIRSGNVSAVICTTERAAVQVSNRLLQAGFRIPADISVVTVQTDGSRMYPGFSFTGVSLGLDRIQDTLLQLLEDRKCSESGLDRVIVHGSVQQGSSSGPPKYDPGTKKLAIALHLKDHPTMRLARAGFLNMVSQLGYQAEVDGISGISEDDYAACCQRLLDKKPDGIVLWRWEPEILKQMMKVQIPIICLHSVMGGELPRQTRVVSSISANPDSIARTVAEFLAYSLSDRSGVVAVTQSAENQLENKITDALNVHLRELCPGLIVVRGPDFIGHTPQSAEQVRGFLRKHPDLLASFSTCGEACVTWARVKAEQNVENLMIIGTDYTEETVSLLEQGAIQAFIAQPVYEEGQRSVEALDAVLRGKDYPVLCQLDAPLVTAANAEKYRRLLREVQNWYV